MIGSSSVKSNCAACLRKEPYGIVDNRPVHSVRDGDGRAVDCEFFKCMNFDDECRHIGEPYGYIKFAWKPVKCRNGKWRWLRWVEHHDNGTYTLSDRAH